MPFCTECGTENPPQAKFCFSCGSAMAPAAPSVVPSEERKVITAIFVDLVGSTARSEQLDPEDVRSLVAPYHAKVRGELEGHGGTFEKFSGDAILALFGTPKAHEDDPERAVRAALAVRQGIAELNEEDEWLDLHIRIGIHTGEALVMLGARPSEGEWSAAGDVLNTAARIQSAAPIDGILVSRTTYLATKDRFVFEAAAPVQAKGKAEPVEVWVVAGAQDGAGPRTRADTRLVGRDDELQELLAFCESAAEERFVGMAAIVGSPGVGKSRLLLELVRRLESRFDIHRGKCLSYGEGITYWPVMEVFKSAAGIRQSDDREAITARLDAFLEGLPTQDLDELRTVAAAISNLIGFPTTPRGTYVTSEISQAELHWGIRRALELMATQRPTAVVVEDLHWAEPTLLELISYVLVEEPELPLVIVGTARPELADEAPGFLGREGRRRTVALQTLGPEQAAALLGDLTGDSAYAETAFAEALIANAGGNPLFLEETVRMLRDEGLLDLERWQGEEMRDVPVPTSIQGLISSRLDRLEPKEKLVAHHASVVGAVFWAGAVAHLGAQEGAAPEDPQPGLAELERRDFVAHLRASSVAADEEYSFKHILIRDVAYGQVPKGRRAELHLGFSDWVKGLPSSADEFVEIVAWHLEQACLLSREVARSPITPPLREAATALADAGRRAERRESLREAHRYYSRALDVLGEEDADLRVELRLRRADMAMMLGLLQEAVDELHEVAQAAEELGRQDVEAEALLLLGDIDQRQGRPGEAHKRLLEAERLARLADDPRLEARVEFVLNTFVGDYLGELEQVIENLRGAIATAEAIDDHALVAEGHLRIAALLMSHDLAAAEPELRRCLELAEELGSHRIEAEAASWLGIVAYYRGRRAEAEQLCLQARTWFERTGDTYFQVQNIICGLGIFALEDGRAEEGEEWLREALPVALQIGGWVVLKTYWHLVEALVAQQRLDDAKEIVAFAARSAPEEDPHSRAWLSMGEALVASVAGESAAAAAAFAEALRLFEELDYNLDIAEARFVLGRSLRSFGDVTGARVELERARSIFVRIGADIRRDAVEAELGQLVEGPAPTGPSTA
ncbi:MAG TPA: adenylate/guanylate cyclase domain-containing protein [Gaiellaceae bacterium]|nr:adenylate/guanylate cyclase domain-containing protein [Gaiellaceae bacterium]